HGRHEHEGSQRRRRRLYGDTMSPVPHEPGHLSRSGRQGGEHSIEPSHPAPAPVAGPSHGDPAQGLGRVTPSGAGGFDHSPDGEEASGGGERTRWPRLTKGGGWGGQARLPSSRIAHVTPGA